MTTEDSTEASTEDLAAVSPKEKTASGRLGFLDACRGLAVLFVVFQHAGEIHWKPALWTAAHVVQFGQLGVTVFFLCSGFIIPVSIERGTLRSFWIRRFFRLYPLFWVSLLATYLMWHAGRFWIPPELGEHLVRGIVLNATMMARPLGTPYANELYWTLSFEMVFYLACTVLHRLHLLHRSIELAYLAMAGTLAANLGLLLLDIPVKIFAYPFVAMFVGSVLHRWHAGELTTRQVRPVLLAAAGTVVVGLLPRLWQPDPHRIIGLGRFWPMVLAYLVAGAIFLLALRFSTARWPRPLVYLGLVSYSAYLFHPLLLGEVFPDERGPWPVLAVIAAVVAVSSVTYYLVEKPAIRIGHLLATRWR